MMFTRFHVVRKSFVVSFLVLAGLFPARSSPALPVEMAGQWGGNAKAIAVSGDRLYLGKGQQLLAFDISSQTPVLLCKSPYLQGTIEDISLLGDYAYLAYSRDSGNGGILQVRLTDSALPPTCYSSRPYPASGVSAANDLIQVAYAGTLPSVTTYLIPTNGTFQSPGYIYMYNDPVLALAVTGSHIYIANMVRGITIYDMINPQTGSISYKQLVRCDPELGPYEFECPTDIAVAEPYAYVADGSSGIRIMDFRTITSPIETQYVTNGDAQRLLKNGNQLYVANGDAGIQLLNISTPSTLSKAGEYRSGNFTQDVALSGNTVYAAGSYPGLTTVDFSDPANPTKISGQLECGQAQDLAIRDQYALISSAKAGLQVIDISDPSNMKRAGSVNTEGTANGLCLSGDFAYVADSHKGLKIFNISTPTSPVEVGHCTINHSAKDAVVSGSYAYVSSEDWGYTQNQHYYIHGLTTVNVSQPAAPVPTTYTPVGYRIRCMAVSGNNLLLGLEGYGLCVFDISAPNKPVQKAIHRIDKGVFDIAVDGNLVYLACGTSGLQILDIGSLPSLTSVSAYQPGNIDAKAVSLNGNFAYITDGTSYNEKLHIIDVKSSQQPFSVGSCTGLQTPSRIAVYGNYAIVANESAGLTSFHVGSYPPPEVNNIDPRIAANTAVIHVTNLVGSGFRSGASVKLTRPSYNDIQASEVNVLSSTKISCDFNLMSKVPGLWNVIVTNPDGLQGILANGLGITLPVTTHIYGASKRSANDAIMDIASKQWSFRFCGKITNIDSNCFWLDDGSKLPLKVYAPGHSALANNDFVTATGTIDSSGSPRVLLSSPSGINKQTTEP